MPLLDWSQPVLAIDSSYAVFHRFFALRRWERLSGQRDPEPDSSPCTDTELVSFGDSFKSMVVAHMRSLRVPPGNTVMLIDCPRSEIWRRDVLPTYKDSRPTPGDFSPNVFAFFRECLVPELVSEFSVHTIGFDRAEADDAAGVLARVAVESGAHDVTILSGDCDLAQLEVPGRIRVVDMKGVGLLERVTKKLGCDNDAATYLAVKILQGDRGDNIPAARERLGPKRALKLSDDPALLTAFLQDEGNRLRYERNRTLIDISKMPADIEAGLRAALSAIVE